MGDVTLKELDFTQFGLVVNRLLLHLGVNEPGHSE